MTESNEVTTSSSMVNEVPWKKGHIKINGIIWAEDKSVREAASVIDQIMNQHQQLYRGPIDSVEKYKYDKINKKSL